MTDERMRGDDELFDDPVVHEEFVEGEIVIKRTVVLIDPDDIQEAVLPADTGEPYSTARPDFARGQEEDPARIERLVEDKFSRGQEEDPTLHQQVHQGDFSTGQAVAERHPELELRGRFARGQQEVDPDNPNEERVAG